jgi:methylated-DNA-[protein]-cysteine S-methyltransferase
MTDPAFALFDTPIGACGIAWRGETIIGTALPERSEARLRQRLSDRVGGGVERPASPHAAAAIAAIVNLLNGADERFPHIRLDWDRVGAFEQSVYRAAQAIPVGRTVTYGALAATIGDPGAARAVGAALGRNPYPIIIPCHRILAASGKSGGFSAPGGVETKFRILAIEQARRSGDGGLFAHLPLAVTPSRKSASPQ